MKRILITSAMPYVNGVKHLGNLVGSMLPADVFARFCRARGYETLAICATDEHGAPIELAALEEGMPVARLLRQMARRCRRDLGDRFGLSWDNFGRSSSPQNRETDPAFRPRSCGRTAFWKCAPPSRSIPPPTAASCPTVM